MSPSEMSPSVRQRVLALLTEALDLIDAHGGPGEAAAHLELAIQSLRSTGPTNPR